MTTSPSNSDSSLRSLVMNRFTVKTVEHGVSVRDSSGKRLFGINFDTKKIGLEGELCTVQEMKNKRWNLGIVNSNGEVICGSLPLQERGENFFLLEGFAKAFPVTAPSGTKVKLKSKHFLRANKKEMCELPLSTSDKKLKEYFWGDNILVSFTDESFEVFSATEYNSIQLKIIALAIYIYFTVPCSDAEQ